MVFTTAATDMYLSVWSKYLPIIRIVMKRALTTEQILKLNKSDFERAGMKRKLGYKFSFVLKDGKLKNIIVDEPLASGLASVLMADERVQQLISSDQFAFSLSAKYELTVRHIPQA